MANRRRSWTEYPEEYATLAKSVALADLPALYGPFSRGAANTFRQEFYRYRRALAAAATPRSDSYPCRLYEMIETLSARAEISNNNPNLWNVVFDVNPIVATVNTMIDPAGAQVRELGRARFIAAQRPAALSTPLFSDDEMQERLDEIQHGDK